MPALTPQLALSYLAELSTDIRSAVVLDAAGEALAGPPELAEPAWRMLEAADADAVEVLMPRGMVFAARDASHAVAAVTGRTALPALVLYDLKLVLGDLSGGAA